MTHPAIEAMARTLCERRLGRTIDDAYWRHMCEHHRTFHAEFAIDGACGQLVCDAELNALAALRALAACEPPKGAMLTLGLLSAAGPLKRADYIEAWSAMLAELVKECERDA